MPFTRKKLIIGLLLALDITAFASPPIWWSQGIPPVLDISATADNKGVANVGQAKHMAASAITALRTVLPSVANSIEADLASIVNLAVPVPKTQAWIEKQNSPLLQGQLKAIAAPFYTRINAAIPTWLEAERIANGTHYPGSIFPWTADTNDDANTAIANIGQLKAVFSLRFTHDSDSDGMPDLWENSHGFNPISASDTYFDLDNDGFNNLQEFILGTNPNATEILIDSDNDGMPNNYESAQNLNLNLDDTLEDADGDRVPNIFEFKRGTRANDPTSKPMATFVVNPILGDNSVSAQQNPSIQA